MYFELSILIRRSPPDVFAFLRDKDQYPQEDDSPVLILEKTTVGAAGVGTCYREVVQMLPFVRGEILSKITRYEPDQFLEEDFEGASMKGHLAYQFLPEGGGTRLIQRETLSAQGFLKPLEPVIERMLSRRLIERLEGIKTVLEGGWDTAGIAALKRGHEHHFSTSFWVANERRPRWTGGCQRGGGMRKLNNSVVVQI